MAPLPASSRVGPFHRAQACPSLSGPVLRVSALWIAPLLILLTALTGFSRLAAESSPEDVRGLMRLGKYDKAIAAAREGLASGSASEDWPVLLTQGLLTTGQYAEARNVITNATAKSRRSIRLRWIGREACLSAGDTNQAASYLDDIRLLVNAQAADLRDPRARVALAQAAFLLGADPKVVLEKVLEPVRQIAPDLVELYLVRGQIALEKHDADLASRAFEQGIQRQKDDPDLHYGLARAHLEGDRAVLVESLENALRINGRHIPSLLLLVDHQIDAEDYTEAAKNLDVVDGVNPEHPEAWAYRAVLAHLRNDTAAETAVRDRALRHWPTNPRVDHLIGLKLSRKYRFAEGAAHQRRALQFDPEHLPAKAALASDLLRLGQEEEGWKLAHEVHDKDGYDVSAFNLVTLHDSLGRYTRLTNENFIVRISTREAAIYGDRVLQLLERARKTLSNKYGVEPARPTYVEIFAEQKDFAVRTFGMPDNPGFLGVCFGRVVTANGPAATRGRDSNWEAVLWHEFTHVITLQSTANRMPRWLSEGISVYEELQADPAWGQHFNPRYRSMITGGELVPVSQLSGAFLAPKSPFHLQFAYFESALFVDHLIRRKGIETLKAVLADLREGKAINESLAARIAPLPDLEKDFTTFAKELARGVGPGLDWQKPPTPKGPDSLTPSLQEWAKAHPTNFYALTDAAHRAMAAKDWKAAKEPLKLLIDRFPTQTGADSAWPLLARAHRQLGETNEERQVLMEYAARDHEAPEAYLRLMELASARRDWPEVLLNGRRFLAVNPLIAPPYRLIARAAEETGDFEAAIRACRTLLQLDPPNPADAHFQLARLLESRNPVESRRHVLMALEEAPRHRAALRLLHQLQSGKEKTP